MLSENTVAMALRDAINITSVGKFVKIKEGSPFSSLQNPTAPEYAGRVEEYPRTMEYHHEYSASHKEAQSHLVATALQSTASILGFVQGTVLSEIQGFSDSVTESFSGMRFNSAASEYTIKKQDIPDPIKHNYDLLGIGRFARATSYQVETKGSYNLDMNATDIHKFIQTGHVETDNNIANWFMGVVDDDLLKTWNTIFNDRITPDRLSGLASVHNRLTSINHDLLIYLGAQALERKVDDRASGMDLRDYNGGAKGLKQYAGTRINKGITAYERAVKTGRMVLDNDPSSKSITVLGSAYTSYIKQGGTATALLGRALQTDGPVKVAGLLKETMVLTGRWETYVALSTSRLNNIKLNAFKTVAKNTLRGYLNKAVPNEMEQDFYNTDKFPDDVKRKMLATGSNIIDGMRLENIDSFISTAESVVTLSRYHYTPAHQLLSTMNTYHEKDSTILPHEAYLLSAIDYVSEYLADQLEVGTVL